MWGRSWAEVVREAPGVELVAVADPDPEARRQLADGTPGYEALEAALAGVECEAVLVLTPPAPHHAVAKLALAAGKHVLVEKPLATGLEDGFDLIRAAERAGRVLMVSQNYRYNRPFRAVQRLVTEGTLGELASIKICCRRATRMSWTCRSITSASSGRRRTGMCTASTPAAGVSPTAHSSTTRRSRR